MRRGGGGDKWERGGEMRGGKEINGREEVR